MRPLILRRTAAAEPECPPAPRPQARRPDPAPSRLSYRLDRLWMRPSVRRLALRGVPALAVALGLVAWLHDGQEIARAQAAWADLRERIEARPEFTVATVEVEGASPALAAGIEAALPRLPASSLRLDLDAIRSEIAAMPPVAQAEIRVAPGGTLSVRVEERQAAVLWRGPGGLRALDAEGRVIGTPQDRAARADLPLVAGLGAEIAVPEALALRDAAGPLAPKLRGFVRVGERRWDVVIDGGPRILLPAEGAVAALEWAAALEATQDLSGRDVRRLDLRVPDRPALRLGPDARLAFERAGAEERMGRPSGDADDEGEVDREGEPG